MKLHGIELKPCPFCGSDDLRLDHSTSHGHGDCGYEDLRVICNDCISTRGLFNYGSPGLNDMELVMNQWNRRVGDELVEQRVDRPVSNLSTEDRLLESYGKHMDIIEFLTITKKQ